MFSQDIIRRLDSNVWLSDSGLRQLIEQHNLPLQTKNIRQMTIDLPLDELYVLSRNQFKLVKQAQLNLPHPFLSFHEVRSTIRKLGLRVPFYSLSDEAFIFFNPSTQNYELPEAENFAQNYIGGARESIVSEFSHGEVITSDDKVKKMFQEGFIELHDSRTGSIEDSIRDGFVCFTPKGTGCSITIDPAKTLEVNSRIYQKGSNFFMSEKIYSRDNVLTIPPNEPFNIALNESVNLSPHIGIQMFYNYQGSIQLNGVVDPGYKGDLATQPLILKTLKLPLKDPFIFGRLIYFKNAVQEPYGFSNSISHYQGTKWKT